MPSVKIDDDIHAYLLKNIVRFGETESDVLRRLLKLSPTVAAPQSDRSVNPVSITDGSPSSVDASDLLSEFLTSDEFKGKRNAVERFLSILSHVSGTNQGFAKVLQIRGRSRRYFAENSTELMNYGHGVNPKQIPGTEYWVDTNNDTGRKGEILTQVLDCFDYSKYIIDAATKALF